MFALALLAYLAATPLEEYRSAQASLGARRQELAAQWSKDPAKARTAARTELLNYFEQFAFPAWAGTPWAFEGVTTTPREGTIACGYYVTTVLEQAGYALERVVLAKQASAYLVATVARGTEVAWLRPADRAAAVEHIRAHFGDGLFVVGLDFHVGFLRVTGAHAQFCHSSYLEPAVVTCEEALTSGAFVSRLYVVSDVLNDRVLDDWLLGHRIPSELPKRARGR